MDGRSSAKEEERDEPPDRPGPSNYANRTHYQSHSRSSSLSTPPLPPPFFNPPADLPPDPVEAILSPPLSQSSTPFGAGSPALSSYSPSQRVSPSPRLPIEEVAERPQLRALQRVSAESIPTPQSTGSSAASSEGGDHLAEAREKLLWDAIESGSAGHSRRTSESSGGDGGGTIVMGSGAGDLQQPRPHLHGIASSPQFNLISPTPPLIPQDLSEAIEAGPSRRRMSLPAAEMERAELAGEHAWDSVWPAPGTAVKPNIPPEPGLRYPTAPMSPFITPAFSPAVIPSQSSERQRLPSSPNFTPRDYVFPHPHPPLSHRESQHRSSSPSPLRISPRRTGSPSIDTSEVNLARRRSITSPSIGPLLNRSPSELSPIVIKKHARSQSNSSPILAGRPSLRDAWDVSKGVSPPVSPPRSPSSRASSMASSSESSSGALGMRKQFSNPLATAGAASRRASLLGTSPTSLSGSHFGRPRGRSFGSQNISPKLSPSAMALERPARLASLREDSGSGQSVSPGDSPTDEPVGLPAPVDIPDIGGSETSSGPTLIALPPPISQAPVPVSHMRSADDGMPQELHGLISPGLAATAPMVPTLQSIARPNLLRRAMSEQDTRIRTSNTPTPPSLLRGISSVDVDRSPKRSPPGEPDAGVMGVDGWNESDPDHRRHKSPKLSGHASIPPLAMLEPHAEDGAALQEGDSYFASVDTTISPDTPMETSAAQFVDAGDVLPSDQALHPETDVTFDDEGLNTLERIFLLSKSEYPFHRRYIAGVLGDLLYDVDPCESVEYVLPLLSEYAMDEAEEVKEEFARELHRIIWYFISTCTLIDENLGGDPDEVFESPGDSSDEQGSRLSTSTVTITSKGMEFVPKPTPQQFAEEEAGMSEDRRSSIASAFGTSSSSSAATKLSSLMSSQGGETGTPASTTGETPSSAGTAFSPSDFVNPFADQDDPEKEYVKDIGPLKKRPTLMAQFFTPLLGSLLLSGNAAVADSIRQGLVLVFARLKGKEVPDPDKWGHRASLPEPDERRTYNSQEGLHCHDIHPFDRRSRVAAERALLDGIVLGMGSLSTEMPEHLHEPGAMDEEMDNERELYLEQLMQEASTGRATSMNLIGSLCEYYSGPEAVLNGFVEEVLRAGDGDPLVRAEAAVAVGSLAKIVPLDQVYRLIPLFELFISDEINHVRQSACVALPALCRRIDSSEYRRDFAVRSVLILVDSGPDVKCAVLEMMGEIIYVFDKDPDGPPDELLQVYMDDEGEVMPGEQDSDWDIVASFNFPGVCLTLGPERWHELRDLYLRLEQRAGEKVFRSMSASLHELAKILAPEQVERDLLPVWRRCFDEGDGIRERVFEHVSDTLSNLPWQVGWQEYLDICRRWRDNTLGGWRVREQLALHLPRIIEVFGEHTHLAPALEMTRQALLDPFAAVRDAATKGVPDSYLALHHGTQIATDFREMLLDLANSSKFRQRLTFVRCLREFCRPPPNQKAFEEFFLPHLPRLAQDVVDVRLGLAQIIANLFVIDSFYGIPDAMIPPAIQQLARTLANDDALDVRDTIRNVSIAAVMQGEMADAPYKLRTEIPGARRVVPDELTDEQGAEEVATAGAVGVRQAKGQEDGRVSMVQESKEAGAAHLQDLTRMPVERRPSAEMSARMGQLGMSSPGQNKMEGEPDPFERSFSQTQSE